MNSQKRSQPVSGNSLASVLPAPTLRPRVFDLSLLNQPQRQAVETIHGPVLILAGAGTGKTRVITCRIAHLIAKGIAPEHVLAVTFTNKAAREMLGRVNQMLPKTRIVERGARSADGSRNPQPAPRPTICTFHSLCVRILRQHIERLGYKRNFVIYDEAEQLSAVKKILAKISAKGEKTDPAAILGLLSRYRNGGSLAAAFADESIKAMAEHIRSRYESALRACNAVDFGDLILLTLRLFSEHPKTLDACRAQYRYVMVDEYQDTNAAQFKLVHLLTQKHRNLCVVGDDDQSIYGWRGAEISNLLDMEQHFPEVKVIKLEQNYRSTNTILQAANAIIKHNVRRRAKQLWSQKGTGAKITLHAFTDDDEESRAIVDEIEFARLAHRVPWPGNAVLFRTNVQSRPLETTLRQAGVRYHLIGGQSFFDRREVRDLLAYLKMFLNPHDDVSLLRIANVPARGLSDTTMERLLAASHEHKTSVFAAMQNQALLATFLTRTRESVAAFVEFVERTRGQVTGTPHHSAFDSSSLKTPLAHDSPSSRFAPLNRSSRRESAPSLQGREMSGLTSAATKLMGSKGSFHLQAWAEHFLGEIGYLEDLRRSEKDAETAENRVRNLQDLIATLDNDRGERKCPAAQLQAFLDELTLDTEREEEAETQNSAVTLITMHSCKGLEFPHVFIAGMEDGLLPHTRSKAEGTLDEERRLFYVAMTRAMKTLTISHCAGRRKYGQIMPCHPSPFLKELPANLVELAGERARKPVTVASGKKLFDAMRSAVG